MVSNPTICEEKLTTNNPNRKWGFLYKSPLSVWIICCQYIYIYILFNQTWLNETLLLSYTPHTQTHTGTYIIL